MGKSIDGHAGGQTQGLIHSEQVHNHEVGGCNMINKNSEYLLKYK